MTKSPNPLLVRALGAAVFAVGAWVGSIGLDQHADRKGGPNSPWSETQAVVEGVAPHPVYEDRVVRSLRVTVPDAADAVCPVTDSPEDAGAVGDRLSLWVHADTVTGACRITFHPWDQGFTGAHFFMLFGALWLAMGAAFIIRPPKNVGVGGGDGGPF